MKKVKTAIELKALCDDLNTNLHDIDTSLITDMSELFKDSSRSDFSFINTWDTSNVVNMSSMFENC
ncbi:BspA family leucine-rich repeat surface protein, partial [Campylobacter sp. RM12635]|nr:BspA family leucine-rich repeat surface protein [Campylobacter sp. RM12635]